MLPRAFRGCARRAERAAAPARAMSSASMRERFLLARHGQAAWARTPMEERKAVVLRFKELLSARADEVGSLVSSEMGKPVAQARSECRATLPRIQYFLDHVDEALAERTVRSGARGREAVRREPLGVVGNISAFNYPLFVGSNVWIPALLAGNAVLYKPSEHVTATGRLVAALFSEAGVPPGAFQCVEGAGEAGRELLEQPIDGLFFTGSVATGRAIKAALAERMIPVQLELGGKDAAYVMDDVADVGRAAEALAEGAMYNAGQGCCSVERIYVHESVALDFIRRLVDAVGAMRASVGPPEDEGTRMGPLCLPGAPERLRAQVEEAVAKGAKLECGGSAMEVGGRGGFFEPTVLTNVDHGMRVMREESFGPVVAVKVVEGDEEAVQLMNDSAFGLTAAVYGADEDRALRILSRVDCGTAYLNCCDRVSPRLPWTGRRDSGIGSTCGELGIQAFTKVKALNLRT